VAIKWAAPLDPQRRSRGVHRFFDARAFTGRDFLKKKE
jgi:hypothetical protein